MRLFIFASALIIGWWASPAMAITGNDVVDGCKQFLIDQDYVPELMTVVREYQCVGEVDAVFQLAPYLGDRRFCPPSGSTVGQAVSVVLKWMNDHPEKTNRPVAVIALLALKQAWPCSPG